MVEEETQVHLVSTSTCSIPIRHAIGLQVMVMKLLSGLSALLDYSDQIINIIFVQ